MNAEEEAISPNVTIPFANAWPADPRIVKAVMFVPNSDSRKTTGPRDRPAEIVLGTMCRAARPAEHTDIENDAQST